MRTLLERPAHEVWLNEYGVRTVLAAARRTTLAEPFLTLTSRPDTEFANRAVLNLLSERFAATFVAAALEAPRRTGTFLFAITCEKYEEIRTRKLRVLVVAKQTLIDLFGPGNAAARLQVDSLIYRARLQTLRLMYERYVQDQKADHPVLGEVELGVPAGPR
jgi:hypothetical protein